MELEDSTIEKIYVRLSAEVGRSWLTFYGLPSEHRGRPLDDDSADHICGLYVKYLEDLVGAAKTEFGNSP